MSDRTNNQIVRSHLDDFADDDDDDHNSSANIPPHLKTEQQKRQDFIHRMNQVYIGGHQADSSTGNSSGNTQNKTSNSNNNSNNNSGRNSSSSSFGKKRSTDKKKSKDESNSIDKTKNNNNNNSSKPLDLPFTNSASNIQTTTSSTITPSSTTTTITSSAKQKKLPTSTKQSASSSTAIVDNNATKKVLSGFPKYANDQVLSAVSVPPSEQFPLKDARIGPHHFSRLKLLGRGGIGQVFLVRLKDTDKLYAMKVLTKEEMILRNKVKRVMTEREILATANHPFIVTMYASFQTNDRLCFVMEYCEGGEFFRVLQKQPKKRLKEEAVKFYAAEVILALEYLHHKGFIYRDLKPENILMRANGHIALTDFDLSKQAHAVSPRVIQQQLSISDKIKKTLSLRRNNSSLTTFEIVNSEPVLPYQTNSFVGTEEYIAPEVVNGVGQSSAVDWWTLGILIYEMLTGTTPFKGSYTDETFSNIVHEKLKWPDDITISNDCKQLVSKLLRREADKRLGAENGASDIRRSKWFKDFNFELIRNKTPPIIPKLKDVKDFSQYGTDHDDGNENSTNTSSSQLANAKDPENPFVDFDMRRDEALQRQY